MNILIQTTGEKPIYEQIATQIKASIAKGQLAPGDALPSIRALAQQLRVSVITTKRAYSDLEQAGFLCTVPGKGSFVAPQDPQRHRAQARQQTAALLLQVVEQAAQSGISKQELLQLLQTQIEGVYPDE